MKLKLTNEQLAVVYELLWHVRLGDRNEFESAISDLMVRLEEEGIAEKLPSDMPKLSFEFSEDEGVTINVQNNAG